MRQVCPLCALDDEVTAVPLGPGVFEYNCGNKRGHPSRAAYRWTGSDPGVGENFSDEVTGPAAELGMLDDLRACLKAEEGWVEYGIVEDRYAKLNPEAFDQLRERYGHRILGPQRTGRHTASVYIARVLAMLRDRDMIAFSYGPATGPWSYNGSISYWARLPAPVANKRITYAEYAEQMGPDASAGASP
jgi:hypothetical protein